MDTQATLSFNMEEPESTKQLKLAVHAPDLALLIWNIKQVLREQYKNEAFNEPHKFRKEEEGTTPADRMGDAIQEVIDESGIPQELFE